MVNVGKLIAEISVFAIVIYCCYGAIVQAIPFDISSPDDAFHVNNLDVNTSTDGLELTVDFKGSVTSGLPQDVDDVTASISLGNKDTRMKLTSVDIGSLKSKSTTEISKTATIPTYALLAYGVEIDDSGTLTVPLVMDFTFKYMKWHGSYLIDLGIGVKQDFSMVTGSTLPTITAGSGPNSAKISMTLTDDGPSGNPLVNSIVDQLNQSGPNTFVMMCGDAGVILKTTPEGKSTDLSLEFTGDSSMNAADLMRSSLQESGKLVLTYDGKEYVLENENAETFISLIDLVYAGVAT